ncbi:F-box/LRR-repeat protein [Artemisia annua]|uniref:F-box/LRR-repeat protein n=1 Tax=Artemisia annua TaxID=35608 RepID=A0A2U1KWW8_ARTAN|nr:F-box/LRR-repeat protein [Artemisia annua]
MEEGDSRRWEDLDPNILAKIFRGFDIFDLTSGIAHTCSSWRNAACDPLLWKTLDLSMLKSNFIKIPLEPYVYVDGRSDRHLTRVLKLSLNLSRGCITTLLFHYYMYVSDAQLTYTAERTPKLKRLVLPAWNRIKRTGICKAISLWNDLESLTMPSIANPPYLMEAISQHCKNFSELKILGPCDMLFVQTLIRCVPNLKVLSIRCSILNIEALQLILDDLKNLEVLNISHCFIVEVLPPPATRRVIEKLDSTIMEKGKRLREFYTCLDDSCIMCQRSKADEGLMRWYKYDGLWKEDEVKSLAV